MQVLYLTPAGIERHGAEELAKLLAREDGFVWVDIPECDDAAAGVLADVFGFHPMAIQECRRRNHVPTVHVYADHLFVVTHVPELGSTGHVHLLELDQFVGERYLVTVHGPINPALPAESALVETSGVLSRLEAGRRAPAAPAGLCYAITNAVVRRQRTLVDKVAVKVAGLEQQVMTSSLRSPEVLLEEMFLVRHELITVRTMAAQGHEVFARAAALAHFLPPEGQRQLADVAEQQDRVRRVCDGEKEFLFGVIDLFQTRTTTKMTIAMERLAVLAAVTLPVTAIASVAGMNVIVNEGTRLVQLLLLLAVMLTISGMLLRWTRKQGWW
jgi:Mg2+ and Co2+ transporter CorA